MNKPIEDWAAAIAKRVMDEWAGCEEFPEDATRMQSFLQAMLTEHPAFCRSLVGSGFIEENYWDPVDIPPK